MVQLTRKQKRQKAKFYYNYIHNGKNNASNSEVDPNANVSGKNVATMRAEGNKDIDVQMNRYMLGNQIQKQFGWKAKHDYYASLRKHNIYIHDESAILSPYCVAIDSTPLIKKGMGCLGGEGSTPKHLFSYCGSFVNAMYYISSQFAGAVADVSFFKDFDYFARKDFGDDYVETNTKELENFFQFVVYTIGQPAAARGNQSIFFNTSIFDKYYFEGLFGDYRYPDGSKPIYSSVSKLQKSFMRWFNKERERALLTFPVMTACMLTDKETKLAKDDDFKDFLADEMSKANSFFIYSSDNANSISSCCRLRSEINVFEYSLGGTGIMTGSKKVITINVNRLVQDRRDITKEVQKIHKYLVAWNEMMHTMQDNGLLPVYDAGFISLEKQFLTIGVNGVAEAAEYLGYTVGNNQPYLDFLQGILEPIKKCNSEEGKYYTKLTGHKVVFNTEFVPAENLGVKFAKWDKKDHYKVPRDCYNSYMYLVEDDTNPFDKFAIHGESTLQYLDGGSAVHLNLKECPNKGTWLKVIDAATKYGCNYWTYNVRETCCNECGFISKEDRMDCPKCHSKDVTWATRVIGYLKKVDSWAEARQEEEKKRNKF